jgi:N6-adenosine-specific RNA methylase IME4
MKLDREILRKLPHALRVEIEENAMRKPLTQSELAHQQRRILEELRKHAKPGARTDLEDGTSEKAFSQVADENRATAVVGKLYGESHKQVEKRLAVLEAAEAEPERFGNLLANMDRTNRVDGNFKRLKVIRQADAIRAEPPPLPGRGPYYCAVIDFPWADDTGRYDDPSHRLVPPYPPMTLEEICAFPLASILAPDAVVWMWTETYHVTRGIHLTVLAALGLRPKSMLTWGKPHFGGGDWLRGQTEHCIMAVRGKPVVTLTNQSTLLLAPPREANGHSLKPREFYDLVESLCPAPRYADLFSRYKHNDRWDCHGDQAPHDDADSAVEHDAGGAAR